MDVAGEPTPQVTKEVPTTETIAEANSKSASQPEEQPEKKIPMPGAVRLIGDEALDAEFKKKVEERQRRMSTQV